MRLRNARMRVALAGGYVAAFWFLGVAAASVGDSVEVRSVFALQEVSGFVDNAGHSCPCRDQAEPNVMYPAFSSDKPQYGEMRLDMEMGNQRSGTPYHFALDESNGTGTGYDRLYLDLNTDGNLCDDAPSTPLPEPPAGALLSYKWIAQQVCFRYVTFSDRSAGSAALSVETMPRLTVSDQGYASLTFVATKARQGEIRIARRKYRVTLVNNYPMGTRWDRPETTVKLESPNGLAGVPYWLGVNRLMAMHEIQGTLWHLSATPEGDQLSVETYRGDFGTLTVGSGKQFAWNKELAGSLFAKDKAVLAGREPAGEMRELVSSCRVPVGDYAPEMMNIRYGPLFLTISSNYHEEGAPRGKAVLAHPLKIRKDETCALDFSDEAEVLFVRPVENARVRPGDELGVYAVLVDPKLDIMIRDLRRKPPIVQSPYLAAMIGAIICIPLVLWRLGRKAWRHSVVLPLLCVGGLVVLVGSMGALYAADKMLHPREAGLRGYDVLNPHVIIARANGNIVAEGVMPFG